MKATIKAIVSMICVTGLLGWSLYLGYDNQLMAIGIAAVAGLGGYAIAKKEEA